MKIKVVIDTQNSFKGNGTHEIRFEVGDTLADLKSKIEKGKSKLSASLQNDVREVLFFSLSNDFAWGGTPLDMATILGEDHNDSVLYAQLSLSGIPIPDDAEIEELDDPDINAATRAELKRVFDEDKAIKNARESSKELRRYLTGLTIGALALPLLYYGCSSTSIGSNFLRNFSPRIGLGCALTGAILGCGAAYELSK